MSNHAAKYPSWIQRARTGGRLEAAPQTKQLSSPNATADLETPSGMHLWPESVAGADAPNADRTDRSRAVSFSVVICAHSMERWSDIGEAVGSVLAQAAPADEIVLVIDHNRNLFERCQQELQHIKVIESCETKGLSGARNSGVAAAKGEIVAFLDDDAVADPGWLKAMAPLFENPSICGVGAVASPRWLGARPRWFPDEFLWVVGCAYRGLEAGVVRNGLGCAMGLRRSIFQRVGGFDPRLGRNGSTLPISCEETEFSLRAARVIPNAQFIYAPDAAVEHKVPVERLTFGYFLLRCFAEGVSKARVKRLAGGRSLATERAYVLRTLSGGSAKGIAEAVFRLDPWAGARAIAIMVGLASTVVGYAWESLGFIGRGECGSAAVAK